MRYVLLLISILLVSCIAPISFETEAVAKQLIVEGSVTNEEPPYLVKISYAMDLNQDTLFTNPETDALVILRNDQGQEEILIETSPGVYETSGIITGEIGRAYSIYITTNAGDSYQSSSEPLLPVGEVNEIRYEYESRNQIENFGEVNNDVFNVFVDASGGPVADPLIRWKMTGIYKVETYPAFRMTEVVPYTPYKDPVPCSGYIVVEALGGGKLEQIGPCTCCECWVYDFVDLPQLNDEYVVENQRYLNVKVGEIPITNYTFHDKYMVEIQQMSLSEQAFNFYKSIRSQKLSSKDLFQPQVGELIGNIYSDDPANQVLGLFYASAIHRKRTFISRDEVPYPVVPITYITEACDVGYESATTSKPEFWID